ncbi:PAP2 superfamily domain-containing protein [Phthorimaea operculella]|nr:PAP2 superfamily domain-containing protein [Phthorimaea operculella]
MDSTQLHGFTSPMLGFHRRDLESQYSKTHTNAKHSVFWTLGVDVPIVIIVAVVIGLIELGIIPSHKRGFYCNDPGLSLPFKGDTVSTAALLSSIFLLPLPVLLLSEWVFLNPDYLQRPRVLQAAYNTLWLYRSYGCGLLLNFCAVEVMKIIVGASRPCFFAICQPDTARTCQGTEYVESFQCTPNTGFSDWKQRDSYRSFFSGHSSLSFHCALFTAWYLQRRVFSWRHRVVFLVPFLQACLIAYASLCALSRVTDNMHHWWDVATGVAVGIASATYSATVLCSNFSYAKRADDTLTARRTSSSMMYSPRRPELIS